MKSENGSKRVSMRVLWYGIWSDANQLCNTPYSGVNNCAWLLQIAAFVWLFEMGWKAAEKLIRHWKVLRGDNVRAMKIFPSLLLIFFYICKSTVFQSHLQVMIIRGKDKGETGIIKRVIRSQNRVIVEGKNLVSVLLCCWYILD